MNALRFCLLVLVLATANSNTLSAATTLDAAMTVDNEFTAYISTDDSVQGTQIGTGNSWPTTYGFNSLLTPDVTNYLHIVATDTGPPAMFIGSFTLSNSSFAFDNGTQSLVSNSSNWSVSTTGFGANYSAPQDLGGQGTAPWGSFGGINAAARFIWHSGGPGNTVYFSTEISPVVAGSTTRATFTVQKEFTDGNDETEVTVNIQCFTGVPLNQSATRTASDGDFEVEFVVESFDSGQLDCEIGESDVAGYSADYEVTEDDAGSTQDSDNGVDACEFENVNSGADNVCIVTNSPVPVEIEINKVWVIEGSGGDDVNQNYELTLHCDGEILGQEGKGYWNKDFSGTGDSEPGDHTAAVIPDWDSEDGAHCYVTEDIDDDAVETDLGDCNSLDVELGSEGLSCTVTNTVFFEGIPTLSQYGMAILALLMLSVGFVGFRRFV